MSSKCKFCNQKIQTVYGIPKEDVYSIFKNTVGPMGKYKRRTSKVPGYILFAQTLIDRYNKINSESEVSTKHSTVHTRASKKKSDSVDKAKPSSSTKLSSLVDKVPTKQP